MSKTSLDIHHIIPVSKNGSDDHNNLIVLCPNCHRLAHEKKLSSKILFENSLEKTLPKWQEAYQKNTKNFIENNQIITYEI